MKTKIEIEVLDFETVQLNVKIELPSMRFLKLASIVYQMMMGVPLPLNISKIENQPTTNDE